jgi:DNA-binding beta-propeller fold protein YncE
MVNNSPTENSGVISHSADVYHGGDIATNPVTNRIYVATNGYDFPTNKYRTITVIDGSTNIITACAARFSGR